MTSLSRSKGSVFLRTILAWDFFVALAAAVVVLVLLLTTERELIAAGTISAAAIPFGMTACAANIISLRWVSDRLRGTAYGQIVRYGDSDESVVSLPYWIVALAGALTSIVGIVGYATDGELPRTATAALFATLLGLGAYTVLGTLSLFRMSIDHQRRSARLQSIQEDAERAARREQQRRAGEAE